MFSEASGISSVLQGKGESGVRSSGHASQLARLGSSRAKKRALIVEDALEKVATLYLKLMQVYDAKHYKDEAGNTFIAEQFTDDYVVKVDAHSNSPIFTEDLRQLAFNLFKAKAIDTESLLDLLEPPMKQLLKDKLKKREAAMAAQPPPQEPSKQEKSDLKEI
jgi:rRNA pseudouridine-1189 N-methylase Emg1 (Nep1/Mra1 family)